MSLSCGLEEDLLNLFQLILSVEEERGGERKSRNKKKKDEG